MNWYQLDTSTVLDKLQSTTHGLSTDEAEIRLAEYGPNTFVMDRGTSRLQIVLHQFTSRKDRLQYVQGKG
jgi:magnesium-transporting ATPase (P-type)